MSRNNWGKHQEYKTVQIDYDRNRENLVNYIQDNYKESELIDFAGEHRKLNMT